MRKILCAGMYSLLLFVFINRLLPKIIFTITTDNLIRVLLHEIKYLKCFISFQFLARNERVLIKKCRILLAINFWSFSLQSSIS